MLSILFLIFGKASVQINSQLNKNEFILLDGPYECPSKPSGTVDDLSTNPSSYKTNSILYGCSLNIEKRINSNLHCVSLYSCTFDKLQDSSEEGGGAIYILTKGKNPSNSILNYIEHCHFNGCQAKQGGAISISTAQPSRLFNIASCTFSSNKADTIGGAICFKGVYSIIDGSEFKDNEAGTNGNDIYFECGETSGGTDKRGFTITNSKFEMTSTPISSNMFYLKWIKSSDLDFNSNTVYIKNDDSNSNDKYFFEFSGTASDVTSTSMKINSNCINSNKYICKSGDAMKTKFESGFPDICDEPPIKPVDPTTTVTVTITEEPIKPVDPTETITITGEPIKPADPTETITVTGEPIKPADPTTTVTVTITEEPIKPVDPTTTVTVTQEPVTPVIPTQKPYECPSKPSGTVDDLSTNPSSYKTNSILYGCSLNIEKRINSNLHCVSLYSCTFNKLQDSSEEGGGAIYILTKGKTPSNSIFNYIEHCHFNGCQAKQGGAISISTAQPSRLFNITSCTFSSNKADTIGGAICFKGVYSIIDGSEFKDNEAGTNGNDIYFECGETSGGTDKRGFTITNSKFEMTSTPISSNMFYLKWIKSSDLDFNSNTVYIKNDDSNSNDKYFFEFSGTASDVTSTNMKINSNCINSNKYICKSGDAMKTKFESGFPDICDEPPIKPVDPTTTVTVTITEEPIKPVDPTTTVTVTITEEPIKPVDPTETVTVTITEEPIKPVDPTTTITVTQEPVTPVIPTQKPYECPNKPSGTVDDLSTNPSSYKTNSILYGCSLNIEKRINSNLHCVSLYSCTFDKLQDSSEEGGGAIYILTKGKTPSNSIFNYIEHCHFNGCQAKQGGAISISTAQPSRLFNIASCTFSSNKADTIGGAICFKGVYSIIDGSEFKDNEAGTNGNDIYFECGETSGGTDKRGFTITNSKFEMTSTPISSNMFYLKWIKSSDLDFNSNTVYIKNDDSNSNDKYFFEFSGTASDVTSTNMKINSNCINSNKYICKSGDAMKTKFESGFPDICDEPPIKPVDPTTTVTVTITEEPIKPVDPTETVTVTITEEPIKPVDPTTTITVTQEPVTPVIPTQKPYECPNKPSGTVDDLSTNPSSYKTNSILYGCSLNIEKRINSNLHCVSLYSCTFNKLQDSSEEGGGAIYILTKGKTPSNSIFNYIEHCHFNGCQAKQGGAISISTAQPSRLFNITSCTFSSNKADTIGGAICFKGVYSIIDGSEFKDNEAGTNGNDIYFECGETSGGTDKRGFTITNSKFEMTSTPISSNMFYLKWIKSSDLDFNSNTVYIKNDDSNSNDKYFFEFSGTASDVTSTNMKINSNCINSNKYICKSGDAMKTKFESGFPDICDEPPIKPVDPTTTVTVTITEEPIKPVDPTTTVTVTITEEPIKPVDPTTTITVTQEPVTPVIPTQKPYECPNKPSGTVDDLSTNPSSYKTNSILYGCSLNIEKRINSNLHCVSLYSCTFNKLQDSSEEGGGAIYILTKGKTPSNSIFNYIEHCHFNGCQAKQGGAISISTAQPSRLFNITSCTFSSNKADTIGGAICFKGVYSIIDGSEFKDNEAGTNGNDIYFECGETSGGTDKRGFTITNSKFEMTSTPISSNMFYLKWIKSSDLDFNSNTVYIKNDDSNSNDKYFFEFSGTASDVTSTNMKINSNCINSNKYICKSGDAMKTKFESGFPDICDEPPIKPVDPTTTVTVTITEEPIKPVDPTTTVTVTITEEPIKPVDPTTTITVTQEPVTPVIPTQKPYECPNKPSGTVDDLSTNPSSYKTNSILYGCSLNIEKRINSNLHCVSLYSCTFDKLQDSSEEGGGAIYILTKGKTPSNSIFNYIEHCHFNGCQAKQGGAISISTAQPSRLFNIASCTFSSNKADTIGGAICFKGVYSIIDGSEFKDNEAGTNGNDIYFECGETSGGTDKRGFTITNSKFEMTSTPISSNMFYLKWIKSSDLDFNSNTVYIKNDDSNSNDKYFFEFSGTASDVTSTNMKINSNCINSNKYICKSGDAMKTKFESGFPDICDEPPIKPVDPTTTVTVTITEEPIKPVDPTTIITTTATITITEEPISTTKINESNIPNLSQTNSPVVTQTNNPVINNTFSISESEQVTHIPATQSIIPTIDFRYDDLIVDSSYNITGEYVEFIKEGFKADEKLFSLSNTNSDIYLINTNNEMNIIKINTTKEKPTKTIFVSPNSKETTAIVLPPSDGSDDFGLGEFGIHANSNLKNIILPKHDVPLNIYNNEKTDISFSYEESNKSTTLSLNHLIVNNGTIQMKIPEEIQTVEFKVVYAYKIDKIETIRSNEQVEIKINEINLKQGSQLTLALFNISNVIKSASESKLIVEKKAIFNKETRIELSDSSLIDFGSSIIEGTCKEIKLIEPQQNDFHLQDEKLIPLICGSNFNCQDWKDKFIGNNEFIGAKCIENNDQICLAASNNPNAISRNTGAKKNLSAGAIVGIVLAVLVVIVSIFVVILLVKRKTAQSNPYKDAPSEEFESKIDNEVNDVTPMGNNSISGEFSNDLYQSNGYTYVDPFLKDFEEQDK